jgi:hypothetical protein
MIPYPPENCDLAVWLLTLIVIALGGADPMLLLERSSNLRLESWGENKEHSSLSGTLS